MGVDASRVCMHCWHNYRHVLLEDEVHVLLLCPRYERARGDLMQELHPTTRTAYNSTHGARWQVRLLLQSHFLEDWRAIGRFTARLRQSRRCMQQEFQKHIAKLNKISFTARKAAWRSKGYAVCSHGVFFENLSGGFQCACMQAGSTDKWQRARYMPKIDPSLRSIIVVAFQQESWKTLRTLQNTLRCQDIHEGVT